MTRFSPREVYRNLDEDFSSWGALEEDLEQMEWTVARSFESLDSGKLKTRRNHLGNKEVCLEIQNKASRGLGSTCVESYGWIKVVSPLSQFRPLEALWMDGIDQEHYLDDLQLSQVVRELGEWVVHMKINFGHSHTWGDHWLFWA